MPIETIAGADTPNQGREKVNFLLGLLVNSGLILSGNVAPATTTGEDGQYYLDTVTGDLYFKTAGAWAVKASVATAAEFDAHTADTTNPHAVAAAQVLITDAGANFAATDVEAALAEEADARQAHEALANNPHSVTAAQAGAVANAGGVPQFSAGTLLNRPGANAVAAGSLYLVTDGTPVNTLYRSDGVAWARVASEAAELDDGANVVTAAQARAHLDSTANPHSVVASQVAIADAGANFTATEVEAALAEEADARQAHEALTTNPHRVTAAQAGAVANGGASPSVRADTLANRPTPSTAGAGAIYIVTDSDPPNAMFRSNGTEWQEVGNSGQAMKRAVNQLAHGLAVNDIVRLSGGSYVKANAATVADAEVVGIVESVKDADNFTVLIGGYLDSLSLLTAGEVYFLQDDGTLGLDAGTISKPLLIADSATSGFFFNFRGLAAGTDVGNMPANGVHARLLADVALPASSYQTIVYEDEIRDDLNAYNPTTGVFVAPETGWYVISTNLAVIGQDVDLRINVHLTVNGAAAAAENIFAHNQGVAGGNTTYVNGSRAHHLTSGDEVKVQVWTEDATATLAEAFLSILYIPVGYGSIDDTSTSLDAVWSASKVNEKTRRIAAVTRMTTTISVAHNTVTQMPLDATEIDSDGMVDLANNQLVVQTAGLYVLGGQSQWAPNDTGERYVEFRVNGGLVAKDRRRAGNRSETLVTMQPLGLAVGDLLTFHVYQTSGAALDLDGVGQNRFWANRLSD
jgi:hypothetical protein